jgi:hypothetical protein
VIVDGVLVSGPIAARFGVLLEQLIRAETRRNGEVVPDELSRRGCCSSSSAPAGSGVRLTRSRLLPLPEVTEVVRTSVLSTWR